MARHLRWTAPLAAALETGWLGSPASGSGTSWDVGAHMGRLKDL